MEKVIEKIIELLKIPYIEENDTVTAGCFAVTPISTGVFYGNGRPAKTADTYSIEIFCGKKEDAMGAAKKLYAEKTMPAIGDAYYDYDHKAKLWKATINIERGD